MADSDDAPGREGAPDSGVTVELSLDELGAADNLPQAPRRSDQLPGLEPERRITDWGRSERIEGLVDRALYDFLYRYWFRVEVESAANVPDGGALLVANHSGAIPSDGAMIAKAIREEHPRPRPVHLATEHPFGGVPGVGMLVTKLGGVSAHPANLHRLLCDERQLVLFFPEGQPGARKPLKARYRLRPFQDAGFVQAAIRAGVPIVPIALVGAEEALPVFGRLNPLRRIPRLPRLALTTAAPLPAKFRIRVLEPIGTDNLGEDAARDQQFIDSLADDVRALIQENLLEMVAARRSVWFG